jgi:hypothetical protein
MVKYVKSSERSERLAGIQKNREQRATDNTTSIMNRLKSELQRFAVEYADRAADLIDTWIQLDKMGDVKFRVTLDGKSFLLDSKDGYVQFPYLFGNQNLFGANRNGVLLLRDGNLGWKYSVPYSYSVGTLENAIKLPGEETPWARDWITHTDEASDILNAIPNVKADIEMLEDYIYSIADSIEE